MLQKEKQHYEAVRTEKRTGERRRNTGSAEDRFSIVSVVELSKYSCSIAA